MNHHHDHNFEDQSVSPPSVREQLRTADADEDGRFDVVISSGETIKVFGPDVDGTTFWEATHGVDVLGDDWEKYRRDRERFVLDWDDTCKDTGKYWIQAHREVLKDFDFSDDETTDDAILALFGNIHVADTLGLERFIKDDTQFSDLEVWGQIKGRAGDLLRENPMDPLLIESLKKAKSMGANLAVWSSSPRELLEEAITTNGLSDIFDAVVSVDDVANHKPHPEGLYAAVKAMDIAQGYLQPGEDYSSEKPLEMNGVWMVGDSPNDVKGGKEAGASTVWIEHPLQGHNAHEKRKKTIAQSLGGAALSATMDTLIPTLTIRTFDPEEAGFSRNTSIMDMPAETVRGLTTVNINLVKFLVDRGLRSEAYRWEHVRKVLHDQDVDVAKPSEDIAAAFYGHSASAPHPITPREVRLTTNADEAKRSLANIMAKRSEDVIL